MPVSRQTNVEAAMRAARIKKAREAFERAAIVARDYSEMAARIFRGNKCDAAELADHIVRNEVALDGGCDAVLLRGDLLPKVLRNLRCLEVTTDYLPEMALIDVTAQIDDEPHVDGFEPVIWKRSAIVNSNVGEVQIRCKPTRLEEVCGRWLLTMEVRGEVEG